MRQFLKFSAFSFCIFYNSLFSQLPDTDIWIFRIEAVGDTARAADVKNITSRAGYDNQPSFLNENQILFTSIRNGEQADIFLYDIPSGNTKQITFTDESEYSPTPFKNNMIHTLTVEKDSTQRVWVNDILHPEKRKPYLPEIKKIGYFAAASPMVFGLFILGDTNHFAIYDSKKNKILFHIPFAGRCIRKIPGEEQLSYVISDPKKEPLILGYDLKWKDEFNIAPCLKGSVDYAWGTQKELWMGQGTVLFRFNTGKNSWDKIVDLHLHGIGEFYRISISPDGKWFAIVTFTGTKP